MPHRGQPLRRVVHVRLSVHLNRGGVAVGTFIAPGLVVQHNVLRAEIRFRVLSFINGFQIVRVGFTIHGIIQING